jgi:hypothetical protein
MADLALPQSLSISDVRRNAMPAIRRTVLHGSTSQNIYGAGELVYIPVDTGTAGAFFVPETSRLDMTVHLHNKNYFVDFINLPRCGFHALIEEFGIEIHNSLHENQRFYAEMIETEMIRNGENMVPFEMTVSNPYEVGGGVAGVMHINLIKPSMVTTVGLPHGVRYAVMQQPTGSNVSSSVSNILSEGMLLNSHPYLKQPLGRNGYGTIADVTFNDGKTSGGTTGYTGTFVNSFGLWAKSNMPASSSYDDRINCTALPTYGVFHDDSAIPTGLNRSFGYGDLALSQLKSGTSYGYDLQVLTPSRFTGYNAAGGEYSKIVPRIRIFGNDTSDNSIFDVAYGQSVGGYTPMMWPAKQPCNMEKLLPQLKEGRRGINTKNVQNYYANCKNIVVSIPVDLSDDIYGEQSIWGGHTHTLPAMSDTTRGQVHSFRVSLKLYSCLIGVYAKKWFPSLLIGAGRMRIRMRLQQPNIAFQTLLDPCRVVPGTVRDRYPYQGVWKTGAQDVALITSAGVDCIAHSVHPILISNYIPGACFNDLVATGKYPVPQTRMKAMNQPFSLFNNKYRRGGGPEKTLSVKPASVDTPGGGTYFHSATDNQVRNANDMTFLSLISPTLLESSDNVKDNSYKFHSLALHLPDPVITTFTQADSEVKRANYWAQEQFEMIHKMLGDLNHEIHRNVHYGYPPNRIKMANGTPVNPTKAMNIDGHNPHSEFIVEDTSTVTPSTSISQFQNYQYHTDFSTSFSDHSLPDNETNTPYGFYAGDPGYCQRVFHPFGETRNGGASIPNRAQPLPSDVNANALNWDPFCHPQPQYVPVVRPWEKDPERTLTAASFVNENTLCYGTFLERSVAQVRRTNQNLFSLKVSGDGAPGITERLTYTVSNIVYRVEEVILPESASMQIIASAMEGGITIEADTIKSIEQILQKQDNQKILLNVSAGIVNDVCFVFQPTEMLQGDKAYGYNSFAFYCPWTSFEFKKQTYGTRVGADIINPDPTTPDDYNYLGGEPQFYNSLRLSDNIAIQTFLSIATEYFPRNPINDLNTLLDHVTWGDQHRGYIEYLGLDPVLNNNYESSNFQDILPFQDGFFSVFTPIECLDDQTITDNPFFTPLECNTKTRIRGKRGHKPALPFFKPFDGTFHLAFNLQAFMHQEDRMNVGTPMVNNNSYLNMQNCHLMRHHETRMLTFIRCFARVIIERGGIVQIFT